jgi:RimJ/RimL family protein N-acetyltransferase
MEALSIRRARYDDLDAFVDHVLRSSAESGQDGAPHFATSRAPGRQEVREAAKARWARGLAEPLWGRAWLLMTSPSHVVGHVELRGGRVAAELHRATLGMGIELARTGKGHGGRLLATAIAWAREDAELAWIDLGVFRDNARARRLYERAGFVEIGVRSDAFRTEGGSIDDVMMTLSLRA